MAETPTTQLDAVNTMLMTIGESPVSSLTGSVGVDVVEAKQTLNTVMKAVQTGGWVFNTEHEFPLQVDLDNHIALPANAASVDVYKGRFGDTDPVARGLRLYDRKNHTYSFDTSVKARIIFLLPFEEMPSTARYYVMYRACRVFQNNAIGSEILHRYTLQDERVALADFENDQAEDEDLNFIRDDALFGRIWRL